MPVYVDNLRTPYGRMVMCHLLADSDTELLAMVRRIGVATRWHQGDHFDICLAKRRMAVTAGAIEITARQAASMRLRRRVTGCLGKPDDSIEWARSYRRATRKRP